MTVYRRSKKGVFVMDYVHKRVLDHIVSGDTYLSFTAQGLL
jgi:hypothetical protein